MFKLGLPELIVIFLAVLLLFGAKALPEVARGLAKGIRSFKKGLQDLQDDSDSTSDKNEKNKS